MIQRIQSVFLLLAAGALGGTFALPLATTPEAVAASAIFADGRYELSDHMVLLAFFGLSGLASLIALFLFRNRPVQLRLTMIAGTLTVLSIVLGVILFVQQSGALGSSTVNDGPGIYLPLAALVMLVLAHRFIRKDERTVRSMDRLR